MPLAALAWVLVAGVAPVGGGLLRLTELEDQGDRLAQRVADLVDRETTAQARLWRYDTQKLMEQIEQLRTAEGLPAVLVEHAGTVAVAVPDRATTNLQAPQVLWRSAPTRGVVPARVHVAVALRPLWQEMALLIAVFGLLATVLAGLLRWLPLRTVRSAEQRIRELVVELQDSQTELQGLAESLERRVAERSEQLAQTAEKLRELTAHAVQLQEDERRSIARDLHDGIGQTLTALRLQLQTLAAKSPMSARPPNVVLSLVDQALDETRRAVRRLAPPLLAELGLVGAIRQMADALEARGALRIAVSVDPPSLAHAPSLGAAVDVACFRIVQEALTNAARHSRVGQVKVTVQLREAELTCEVADDGCGFAPSAGVGGQGLRGMGERAALVGGHLELHTAPGQGCRVVAHLPLSTGERAR